jgi:phosphonate degradation associated HDIG domain protein
MPLTLSDIEQLLTDAGSRQYGGEPVSQLDHALQTATLAQAAAAPDTLVAAALLHDLGHLLAPEASVDPACGHDDLHQYIVLPFLRPLFPPAVIEPIRLHVAAKRYLAAVAPDYHATLSTTSKLSLQLQGGLMNATEQAAFLQDPHAQSAIALRRYDDAAKCTALTTPPLSAFMPLLAQVSLRPSA